MLRDILQKFEKLPEEKKRFLSSPVVLAYIEEIEVKYSIKLALVLMEIVVGEKKEDFINFLASKLHLDKIKAENISDDVKEKILKEFYEIGEVKKDLNKPKPIKADRVNFVKPKKSPSLGQGFGKIIKTKNNLSFKQEEYKQEAKKSKKNDILAPPSPAITPVASKAPIVKPTVKGLLEQKSPEKLKTIKPQIDNFNNDDKEEIKKIKNNVKLDKSMANKVDWDKEAEVIIKNLNINIEGDLNIKLRNILSSTLRGVRSTIDSREVLKKRLENGGMGFEISLIDNILGAIKHRKKMLDDIHSGVKLPSHIFVLSGDGEPMIKKDKNYKDNNRKADKPLPVLPSGAMEDKPIGKPAFVRAIVGKEEKNKPKKKRFIFMPPKKEDKKIEAKEKTAENNKITDKPAFVPPSGISADKEEKIKKFREKVPLIFKDEVLGDKKSLVSQSKTFSAPFKKEPDRNIHISDADKEKLVNKEKKKEKQDKEQINKTTKEIKKGLFFGLFSKNNHRRGGTTSLLKLKKGRGKVKKTTSKKVKIEDVKRVDVSAYESSDKHKLIGPLEELEGLSLIDFRNLSEDPIIATNKIEEKINNLELESLAKRILGIKAWKKCEINQAYLSILNEAMMKNISFKAVIDERNNTRKPTLDIKEFDAIADFNKKLRF